MINVLHLFFILEDLKAVGKSEGQIDTFISRKNFREASAPLASYY